MRNRRDNPYQDVPVESYNKARLFCKNLERMYSAHYVTQDQYKELKVKALSGDVEGAENELKDIYERRKWG